MKNAFVADRRLLKEYDIKTVLGQGGFAQVYLAKHIPSNSDVAIKVIPKHVSNDPNHLRSINKEIEILRGIKHPFICGLYQVLESNDYLYIVLEYLENGTLLDEINLNGPLKERDSTVVFAEIMLAIKYLHSEMHIVHRDLKAENVLYDENHNIRIIDFGFGKQMSPDQYFQTQCGSLFYAAPEIIQGQKYTYSVDIWSAGVLLFALNAGFLPFDDQNLSKLAQKIIFQEVVYPAYFSFSLKDLLVRMLQKDPNLRPTVDEILEHPWIKDTVDELQRMLRPVTSDDEGNESDLRRFHSEDNLFQNIIERQYMTNEIKQIFFKTRQNAASRKSCAFIAIPEKTVVDCRNKNFMALKKMHHKQEIIKAPPNTIKKPKLIKMII